MGGREAGSRVLDACGDDQSREAEGVPARRSVLTDVDGHGDAELVDLGAPRPVVAGGAAGHRRHIEIVDRATQAFGRPLDLIEVDGEGLEAADERTPARPERRLGGLDDGQLAPQRARRLGRVSGHGPGATRPCRHASNAGCRPLNDAQLTTQVVGGRLGDDVQGAPLRRRVGLVDGFGVGGVGAEVEELHREANPTHAVGDGVVHLRQQRRPSALEAFDDRQLPERPSAVEGVLVDEGGQVEELALGARGRQGQAPDVEVQVEGGIVGPLRRGEAGGGRDDALCQPGEDADGPFHAAPEPGEVRSSVQQGELEERGAEAGILLDRPHERLGVAHAAFESERPLRHRFETYLGIEVCLNSLSSGQPVSRSRMWSIVVRARSPSPLGRSMTRTNTALPSAMNVGTPKV